VKKNYDFNKIDIVGQWSDEYTLTSIIEFYKRMKRNRVMLLSFTDDKNL